MKKTDVMLNVISKPRIQNAVGIFLIISLLTFYIFFIKANLVTTFDDAYMFIRYANNAIGGYGIAWNPDGVQTYGATSLLYLLMIVLVKWIFPLAESSSILTITSASLGILSLLVLTIGCAKLSISNFLKGTPLLFGSLLAIIFLLSPGFLFHAASGMDTSLSLLCNSILIFTTLAWVKRKDGLFGFLVILSAYGSFLARPDNLIYSVMFPSLCVIFLAGNDQTKKIAWFLGGLGLLILLDTAIKYMIFGDPLPLPFYAKTNGYDDGYAGVFRWNLVFYIFDFFRMIFPFMVMILFFVSRKIYKLLFIYFLPVLATFIYYFSVVQIMGYQARYYFPAIPFFVVVGYLSLDYGIQEIQQKEVRPNRSKQPVRLASILICAALLWIPSVKTSLGQLYQIVFIPKARVYENTVAYSTESALPQLGWWQSINAVSEISVQLPQGTNFAMSEYGLIGSKAAQINIIDPLGLHDPFFAHHGFSAAEFFDRQPDLIWFPHSDYVKIISAIQNDPEFWTEYDYYPQAFDYGFAIRKDAGNYDLIYKIVKNTWEIYYPIEEIEKNIAKIK